MHVLDGGQTKAPCLQISCPEGTSAHGVPILLGELPDFPIISGELPNSPNALGDLPHFPVVIVSVAFWAGWSGAATGRVSLFAACLLSRVSPRRTSLRPAAGLPFHSWGTEPRDVSREQLGS